MLGDSSKHEAKVSKRLYSVPEAALYLGRSSWSVRRLIWSGELPEVRAGRRVHLDIKDLDTFIDRHKAQES
jgi:excisionase family DNA binding protein